MAKLYTRRGVIKASTAAIIGLREPTAGWPTILHRSAVTRVNSVTLATGISVIVNEYMQVKRFDLKNEIDLTADNSYASLASYYSDFGAGTFDVAVGSWDTFAQMYGRGMPIRLACTATGAEIVSIVAMKNGPSAVDALKGKTLAAVQASGSYKLSKIVIRDLWGIELEKDVAVENVPNPAQAITMLMANRADAALSWEPNISAGLARVPEMIPIFNLGAAYRSARRRALPFFAYAVQASLVHNRPDVVARITKSYADCMDSIMANPRDAIALATPKMDLDPHVLGMAFESGRLRLKAEPMTNADTRQTIGDANEYLRKAGGLTTPIDGGFFAT